MALYSPRTKPGSKVALYMRVSSLNQAKEGQGLDVQETNCMSVIEKNRWTLYKMYVNPEGISGDVKATEREEFIELLKDAKAKKFTVFLVNNLDRIGRKNTDITSTLDILYQLGLKIYVQFTHIENSPLGRLFTGLTGEISQYDKVNILIRMKEGLARATDERGEKQGKVPYGYQRIGKSKSLKVEINDAEAKVINTIYEMRREGKTLQAIANYLNGQGIKASRSPKWDHKKVLQVLTDQRRKIYCGGLRNGGNELGIRWPQILPDSFKKPEDDFDSDDESDEVINIPSNFSLPPIESLPHLSINVKQTNSPIPLMNYNIEEEKTDAKNKVENESKGKKKSVLKRL